jgi:glycosyltransferase involved in cell wall biosynthesis
MKVCIIAEGSYPIVRGGVGEWTHQLIKQLNYVDFDVFCIAPTGQEQQAYEQLPNVDRIIISGVAPPNSRANGARLPRDFSAKLFNSLSSVLYGSPLDCESAVDFLRERHIGKPWLMSKTYWDCVVQLYQKSYPELSFSDFFWTTQGVHSMLLDGLNLVDELPAADIYHSLTSGLGGLVGAMAKVLHARPLVISELGQYMRERRIELLRCNVKEESQQQIIRFSETMLRTSYQYADLIAPVSKSYVATEIELGADPDKIRIVNNGIDCMRFIPGPSKKNAIPIVGCFARIVPIKDQMTFIRACKKVLENHQANFVIIGEVQDREYFRQCQTLIDELGLTENIKFTGYVDNLLEWYHRVDVFVLVSSWEGVPLALLEAMSCGLPCICTAVGGVPDILADTGAGYLVPPSDPDSVASIICELIDNETLRREIGKRASELVKEKYSIEDMTDRILIVYLEGLLNGCGVRQPKTSD